MRTTFPRSPAIVSGRSSGVLIHCPMPVKPGDSPSAEVQRHGDRRRDQHHSRDGADAEHEQIGEAPARVVDRREDEERNGR